MSFWMSLLLFCICTSKTYGENENTTDETSSNMFSPQFLHDDSLFSDVTTTENTDQYEIKIPPEVSTTNNITYVIQDDNIRKLNLTNITLNEEKITQINNNLNSSIVEKNNTNTETKDKLNTGDKELIINITSDVTKDLTNKKNISVIYSRPYKVGKSFFDTDNVTLVYPTNIHRNQTVDDDVKIEIMKIHKTSTPININIRKEETQNKLDENNNKQIHITTTEDTTMNRRQQIRHILYNRRPTQHYLLKVKNNEKLSNDKDDIKRDMSLESTTHENITNNLKELTKNNFEDINRSRKRYQTVLPTFENNTLNGDNVIENTRLINITDENKIMNVTFEEIQAHELNITDYNSHNLKINNTLNYENNKTYVRSNTTQFQASPEYNPRDIRKYDMNMLRFGQRFIINNNNNPQTQVHKYVNKGSNTTKHDGKPIKSIFEQMKEMVYNLRRLPKREQSEYERIDDDITNNFGNQHHLVENYESKKIKPLRESINTQKILLENNASQTNDRTKFSDNTFHNIRNTLQQTRRPLQYRRLNKPHQNTVIQRIQPPNPTLRNVNIINNQIDKKNISLIELVIKSNILMDLERIKMKLQNRNRLHLNETPQLLTGSNMKQTLTHSTQNGRLHKILETINTNSPTGIENDTKVSNFKININTKLDKDIPRHTGKIPQRSQIRQRLRYYETRPDLKTDTVHVTPKLRYQQVKINEQKLNNTEELMQQNMNKNILNLRENRRRPNRLKLVKQQEQTKQMDNNENPELLVKSGNVTNVDNTMNDSTSVSPKELNTVKISNFHEKEFELNASGSENNVTKIIDIESKNVTVYNSTQHSDVNKDSITLQSQRNERLTRNGQFTAPQEFQNGFLPMIINVKGTPLRPIGFRTLRQMDAFTLPESTDQINQYDIASPNLLTYYSREKYLPLNEIKEENTNNGLEVIDQKKYSNTETEEFNIKSNTLSYEAALEQYNKALKMYNNYLEKVTNN